jgi:hypothetical protein
MYRVRGSSGVGQPISGPSGGAQLQRRLASAGLGGLQCMGARAPSPQKPPASWSLLHHAQMSDSYDQALARSQARRRRRIDHSELAKEREKAFYRFVNVPSPVFAPCLCLSSCGCT